MNVDVFFTPAELAGVEIPGRVVVLDVLRATSSMVEAMANGARAIFPVATADDAARIAQNVGRDSVLLCGERKGLPIEGFDLGNAPGEFTAERVSGQALAMTTTNGTRALLAVAERAGGTRGGGGGDDGGATILVGAFLNLAAVVAALVAPRPDPADAGAGRGGVALVCAGREGRFALEDALCAGAIVRGLEAALEDGSEVVLNDAGHAARSLAGGKRPLERVLAETAAGRRLTAIGRDEDLGFCAQVDRTRVVPRLRDRKITVE